MVLVTKMSQGESGAISLAGSDTQPKQTCGYCCKKYKGKKDSKFCSKLCFHGHQKMTKNKKAQIINSLGQGAIAAGGNPETFATPTEENHAKRPLSADSSPKEDQIEPKEIRYEDLSRIMEDKDLTFLDSLNNRETPSCNRERIIHLEANLVDVKLAYADAMTDQFVRQRSSPPVFSLNEDLHHAGNPSYAQATKVQQAPVLLASFGC
ncbi:hypothetical protein OUZ56_010122 [Daphnia magna]|uniref:HIT-type domain-containing protein n=1 Tax=Daphnia magna TaxID=35525 RepID=A0ABR0AI23_9CRUS|nr:hypothetical protein OUZ56_010122 [Daphnia magna]